MTHSPRIVAALTAAATAACILTTGTGVGAAAARTGPVTDRTPSAAPPAAVPPTLDARVQTALDAVVAAGAVGATVEVRQGRRTWRASSGTAEFGGTTPVPRRGRFRAGSVTKTFLATVVLQLVAERRLRLDDRLGDLLPRTTALVPGAEDITVQHLLTHTSGLGDFLGQLPLRPPAAFLAVRWKTWDPWDLIAIAAGQPSTAPGPYRYSNAGYLLLGLVIEEVTGDSYGDQVRRRVIQPLGLRATTMPGTDPVIPGPHAHGYLPVEQDGTVRAVDLSEMNPSVFGAAGELISTTSDLNRFFSALLAGELVRGDLLTLMQTPPRGSSYGLGLRSKSLSCVRPVQGNEGDALTYLTYAYTSADRRRQVALSLTPWGPDRNSTDDAVDTLLDEVLCR